MRDPEKPRAPNREPTPGELRRAGWVLDVAMAALFLLGIWAWVHSL